MKYINKILFFPHKLYDMELLFSGASASSLEDKPSLQLTIYYYTKAEAISEMLKSYQIFDILILSLRAFVSQNVFLF